MTELRSCVLNIYIDIFCNSLVAVLPQPFLSESVYFAAMEFGTVQSGLATAAALAGSLCGYALLYLVGYALYQVSVKANIKRLQSESYHTSLQTVARFTRYLLIFPAIPFYGAFCVLSGYSRIKPMSFLELAGLGKLLYYLYIIGKMGVAHGAV